MKTKMKKVIEKEYRTSPKILIKTRCKHRAHPRLT